MAVTPLPTAPSRQRPVVFAAECDDFLGALPAFGTEVNNLGLAAIEASVAAIAASDTAVATVGSQKWVSGTTYAIGAVTWSPASFLVYRRKTSGAGTTDPASDTTNWEPLTKLNMVYSGRTSNTVLGVADNNSLIDITSGTFTQTFVTSATLRPGWSVVIRNSGTGDITLDPYSTQTLDGLATFIMYPGESRLIQCDGSNLRSVVLNPFYKVFTVSGTFVKPPGYSLFGLYLTNGGSSGQKSGSTSTAASGGGGGGSFYTSHPASGLSASESIVVGAGGTGVTGTAGGNLGGVSSVGSLTIMVAASAYTNGSGIDTAATPGPFSGNGFPYGGAKGAVAGQSNNGSSSMYGGGGGAGVLANTTPGTAGTSTYAGNGGAASSTSSGTAGAAPGGGGGGTQTGTQSGDGGRGEVKIWGIA